MMQMLSSWIEWAPGLTKGLIISLKMTGIVALLGFPLGLVLALLASAKTRALRYISVVLVEIGRGAPALVVLQMVYYGLPSVGLNVAAFTSGAIALSLTTGAYTSEILRAGLNAVPKGEIEAGRALGMTYPDVMRFVVVPQGLLVAVPAMMGFAILVFQMTALTFTVSVTELLAHAYEIGAASFRYFDVLLLAGILYLVIVIPFGWIVERTERRLNKHFGQ
ncbi:amino acid ABC transporter permease [Burkholderia sp. MR1-5-21]